MTISGNKNPTQQERINNEITSFIMQREISFSFHLAWLLYMSFASD